LLLALLGGVVFNLANILLVAAIDIAGLAVAFPVGIGLALVVGVVTNYVATPLGNPLFLFSGVAAIVGAIVLDAVAYKRLSIGGHAPGGKGIVISVVAGLLMGMFYRLVAASMSSDFTRLEPGRLSPYTAVVVFAVGLLLSTFLWNSLAMTWPLSGPRVAFADYFRKGSPRLHVIGMLGGLIWCVGMSFSIIASGAAGFPISYALGQGATLVAALWGVFVWREFKHAARGTSTLLGAMFVLYVLGLALIVVARVAA
jgi:glucose uptake protein